MPLIALNRIVLGANVRAAEAAEAEEGLRASVAAQGVLQAILLRPLTDAKSQDPDPLYQVVLGSRRYHAALAAGLTKIPAEIRAMTDAEVAAAQLAENIQRRDMHPVDLWRGVAGLIQAHGMSFDQAAGALGLDHRVTRRLEMLGRLEPALLTLARIQMPSERALAVIARAPRKIQAAAARGKTVVITRGAVETVDWQAVESQCRARRISRSAAIFDWLAVKGLVWDEDLFAEPGSDAQFTTADVTGFMMHQTKALQAQVAEAVAAKQRHAMATMIGEGAIPLPHGFRRVYDGNVKKLRRHETAFHAVGPDGHIVVAVGLDTKAAKATEDRKKALLAPVATSPAEAKALAAAGDDADAADDDAIAIEPAAKPALTKAGLGLVALAKGAALRAALEQPLPAPAVLNLLVLALAADNVAITAGRGRARFDDLILRMLAPGGGMLDLSLAERIQIATTAIGRMMNVLGPAGTSYNPDSGAAAEWIGAALDAARHLPRFDTEMFLATASLAELKRAALDATLKPSGTAAELRQRLKGHAPDYRPEAAQFGAPAPKEPKHV